MDGVYWSIMVELVFYGWMFTLILLNLMHRIREFMIGPLARGMRAGLDGLFSRIPAAFFQRPSQAI